MMGAGRYTFHVILAGDGKLMMVSNAGQKCCCCPNLDSMAPSASFKVSCWWGASGEVPFPLLGALLLQALCMGDGNGLIP